MDDEQQPNVDSDNEFAADVADADDPDRSMFLAMSGKFLFSFFVSTLTPLRFMFR